MVIISWIPSQSCQISNIVGIHTKLITKLEKNGSFVYESVPGTAVNDFKATDTSVSFMVEGNEDAQITLGLEEGTSYDIRINDKDAGTMATNMGGKLVLSVEFDGEKPVKVDIKKA